MSDTMHEAAAVWVPIEQLKPWAQNPRKNDGAVDEIVRSIRRFGFGAPLLAREADGELIAGHTRLKAAIKLGLPKVPVRYLNLDPVEAHLLGLADNKLGELAEWDDAALGRLLADLREQDVDLTEGIGFSDEEIRRLIASDDRADQDGGAHGDDGEVPEPSDALLKKWSVEPGQLWSIAGKRGTQHRLLCGDCRRSEDVARLLGGRKVNIAFTSPPYAAQREYDESSGFKPIAPDHFVDWFDAVQSSVRAHLTGDGSFFINIKEHAEDGERVLYVKDLVLAHVRRWHWKFVDELCWVRKGVPGGWPNRFKNGFEPVFHFSTERAIKFRPEAVSHQTAHAFDYSPETARSKSGSGLLGTDPHGGYRNGLARPTNVIELNARPGDYTPDHPAQFPVGLPEFFIRAYSDPGDVVLDPFVGAGTTLLAAEQTGRNGYGIEIAPRYCAVVLERLAACGLGPRRE